MKTTTPDIGIIEMHIDRLTKQRNNIDAQIAQYHEELRQRRTALITSGPYTVKDFCALIEWAENNPSAQEAVQRFWVNKSPAIRFDRHPHPTITVTLRPNDDTKTIAQDLTATLQELTVTESAGDLQILIGRESSSTLVLRGSIAGDTWQALWCDHVVLQGTLLQVVTAVAGI